MTSIDLPGALSNGLADWGRKTPAEMIKQMREQAVRQKAEAEQVLAAADEDFRIMTYVGVHVRRKKEVLQKGRDVSKG